MPRACSGSRPAHRGRFPERSHPSPPAPYFSTPYPSTPCPSWANSPPSKPKKSRASAQRSDGGGDRDVSGRGAWLWARRRARSAAPVERYRIMRSDLHRNDAADATYDDGHRRLYDSESRSQLIFSSRKGDRLRRSSLLRRMASLSCSRKAATGPAKAGSRMKWAERVRRGR